MLVVLEGVDGAGTTTQTGRLAATLTAAGRHVHATREPSDGPIGQLLRRILAGEHSPVHAETMALLFAADRADHLHREVEPALASGALVISDRWYHSSLAYQGSDADRTWIRTLNERMRIPELTVFLRCSPEVAAHRRAAAGRNEELYDRLETQRRVAAGYEAVMSALVGREPVVIIDGEQSEAAVAAAVAARVDEACAAPAGATR